jgi:uncharacterized protein YjbJ (UPF0337 family)
VGVHARLGHLACATRGWASNCTTETGENKMTPGTQDQIEGKIHEVKGKIKQAAGQAVGNPDVEAEGRSENLAGKIQQKIGQVEKVFEK